MSKDCWDQTMEIDREIIKDIIRKTSCEFTRGYLSCLIDTTEEEIRTGHQLAAEIIDSLPTQKIQAIKKIRERFGFGLKEAKQVVDHYNQHGKIIFPGDDDFLSGAMVRR